MRELLTPPTEEALPPFAMDMTRIDTPVRLDLAGVSILVKKVQPMAMPVRTFQRPAFQRMLRDVESGRIRCVLVKDLSRFGRDYIETGRYLERWLPEHGVRFIAVTDNIDSARGAYDMMMPLKNLFNTQYARDISRKVKSSLHAKQQRGEFIGAFASYGYCKDPQNHNRLVIDPPAAEVVRRIFTLFENGMGKIRIAKQLNEEGIPCPSEYKRLTGEKYRNNHRLAATTYWTYATIHRILQNEMYIGNMEQGRDDRLQMHGKARRKDRSRWTVVPGTHQPIIEQDQWQRVQTLLNTTATELLTDANGAVVGVKATGSTGETITVNAKAVVLTTGGFGANLDMVTEYKPELKGFMTTNAAGAQGQGIEMATAIGAGTVDMDQIQIHPTVEANTAALITEGLRGDGAVLINAEGKRFIDEVGTRDVVSAAEIAQTGSYSWLVVDQAMVDASSVIQGYIKKGYTVTGETYEELGKAMGVDEAAFAETMKTWNGYVEAKNDPDFGRTSFANPLDTAPYYAIKVTAGVHHTMGGLTINTNTEVLKEDGTVIPGLFAAGEVTGGVHGANRLGGNAVADFTVFGRIAGKAASDYAA